VPLWVLRALTAARHVPWRRVLAAVIWLATAGRKYWDRLTPEERRELMDLMRKSKGKRSNLTKKEQDRVTKLFDKIRREGG
jgi:TRAP-type C4-dicarboxylate transport system substrate-binding protein